MTRLQRWSGRLVLVLAAAWPAGAGAQIQDIPTVVSPLRVETDHNGVNLVSGRTQIDLPVLSVPAAPNLRFDRIQNAAPYALGKVFGQAGEMPTSNWTVHTGEGNSESFQCVDWQDCSSVTGTGSTFRGPAGSGANGIYRHAGTGAVYHYNRTSVVNGNTRQSYLSLINYPSGETISYTYETTVYGPFGQTFYRPVRISSNLGYYITIAYQGDVFPDTWSSVREATLYAETQPLTPLGRLTYTGSTVTDLGGRVYSCTGCVNAMGMNIEVTAGTVQLAGESTPTLQVTALPSQALVGSVTRDGVAWNYSYTYNGGQPYFHAPSNAYWYTRLTVTGPNSFNQVYDLAISSQRNVMTGVTDSIGRTTQYQFDSAYRPTRITYPEGNQVNVLHDEAGNIVSRTATPKAGSGLSPITETAFYPIASLPNFCTIACYRATWSRDGMNRQTDYLYNGNGQLTEQTDPADATGVRRRTYVEYALSGYGVSRRSVVRVCGVGTTCGTSAENRTEYEYWGYTNLPSLERRIDAVRGITLTTTYSYDGAGRLVSTDGPLAGEGDALYNRYDVYGRKTWEIGAQGPNGLRIARRFTYRDADDKPMSIETGTIPDAYSSVLTPLNRTDYAYDGRRNQIREAISSGATTYSVVQKTFDNRNRLECEARRMNPAIFASLPASACTLGTQGTGANDFGPDRITRNLYDNADQLLTVQRAYGTPIQQNYASYSYSLNGKQRSVTDANGNRAEITYDGHDRQRRWIFPSATAIGSVNVNDYEEYGYDAAGNRLSVRKRDGSTLLYQFDNLNRMIVKIVPERAGLDPSNTRDVYYAYNLQDLQTEARYDSLAGEGVSNGYDGFGRMISSTTRWGAMTPRTLAYEYAGDGTRTRITYPDGQIFTYVHDALSRLSGIYEGIGTAVPVNQYGYNPRGLPETRTERYGSNVTYGYDPVGRPNSQADAFVGGTGNVTLGFNHNPANQVINRSRNNDAYAWTGAYNVSRGYSVNGLNQYTAAGGASFTYDANGNLTADGTRTYTYDVENRLVGASGGVTLAYDPMGRLSWTTGSPSLTRFLYDGDALVGEYDYDGNLMRRYVHGSNADADDPLVWYEGASLASPRWLHADRQGSIVATTAGASGALSSINAYDEWGIPNATNQGRFQYTGQAWLPELGMYYYKARMYSPTLGRFMQTDPVGYEDQVNLYAYSGNDPVNLADFLGKCLTDPTTGVRTGICGNDPDATRLVDRMLANPNSRFAEVEAAAIASGNLITLNYTMRDPIIAGFGTEPGDKPGDSNVYMDPTESIRIDNVDANGNITSSRMMTEEEGVEHEVVGHAYDAVKNPNEPRSRAASIADHRSAIDAENAYRARAGINFQRNYDARGVLCDSHRQCPR